MIHKKKPAKKKKPGRKARSGNIHQNRLLKQLDESERPKKKR